MSRCPMLAAAVAALSVALLPAQQDRPRNSGAPDPSRAPDSVATRVHEAWLTEVLDLDVLGAAEQYDLIQKQAPRSRPERWIAVTRLAELQALDVLSREPASVVQAPEAVRKAIAELPDPPAAEQLLANLNEEQFLPPLHSATAIVQSWLHTQFGANATGGQRARPQANRWTPSREWAAVDVLRVELSRRPEQAQALRSLYFPSWKPPVVAGDADELLALVRSRLAEWLAEQNPSRRQYSLLKGLGEALDAEAEKSPAQALELVTRLPLYAERLLLDQRPAPETESNGGPGRR